MGQNLLFQFFVKGCGITFGVSLCDGKSMIEREIVLFFVYATELLFSTNTFFTIKNKTT